MALLIAHVAVFMLSACITLAARDLGVLPAFSLPNIPLIPGSLVPITIGDVGLAIQILGGDSTIELLPPARGTFKPRSTTKRAGPFLYVWNAYGKSYTSPLFSTISTDFLVAIDLGKNSSTYKKVVHLEPLPSIGNEPHHISISYDRKRLLGGGLLSFLRLQDDLFLFDIATDPATPKFLKSAQLPLTAVTDHVFGLRNGQFLTTQMGSKVGGTPGGLSVWSTDLKLNGTYPTKAPTGFNPHGADVNKTLDLLVTSDFILPVSTVTAQVFNALGEALVPDLTLVDPKDLTPLTDYVLRNTVRVWKLSNLKTIQKTITLPGAKGIIDIKLIPGSKGLAYATGVFDGSVWFIDSIAGTALKVLNFGEGVHPHLLAPANTKGTRFFLTLNLAGIFVYLDTTNPKKPKILDSIYLGNNSSPHYITPLGPGDNRVAVADYFLDQGVIGKVHAGGNKKVFIIPYNNTKLKGSQAFSFDFKPLNGRPHGLAVNLQYTDVEA